MNGCAKGFNDSFPEAHVVFLFPVFGKECCWADDCVVMTSFLDGLPEEFSVVDVGSYDVVFERLWADFGEFVDCGDAVLFEDVVHAWSCGDRGGCVGNVVVVDAV